MARKDLNPMQPDDDRLETLGAGALSRVEGRTVRIQRFERSPMGRLEVVLDTGAGLERMPAPQFFQFASAAKPPEPNDPSGPEPPHTLDELPDHERRRVEKRYADLLQITTGSRRGTPDQDRAEGRLSPTYDPDTTGKMERYRAKSRELQDLGEASVAVNTLRKQAGKVAHEGIGALIHRNRKPWTDHLANVDDEVARRPHPRGLPAAVDQNPTSTLIAAGPPTGSQSGQTRR